MRLFRPALILALLCACPSEQMQTDTDTGSTGSTGSATQGSSTGDACEPLPPATDDCCCFSVDNASGLTTNRCPEAELCPAIVIACSLEDPDCPIPTGGNGTAGAITVSDAAALDCILTALRDGTPGKISWSFEDMESGGMFKQIQTQHIQADRSVLALVDDDIGTQGTLGDLVHAPLKPAADFTTCLAEIDIKAKALCLKDTTTGTPTTTCAMGGPYTKP